MSPRHLTSAFGFARASAAAGALALAALSACAPEAARYPPAPGWAPPPPPARGEHDVASPPSRSPIAYGLTPTPLQPNARGTAPASRYAKLAPSACLAELERRGVPHRIVEETPKGVSQPIRLIGPMRGVHIRPTGPIRKGKTSIHDILDCRLALALHDFTAVLAAHSVSEIRHLSMYRPGAKIRSSGRPSQHGSALAIDVGQIIFTNGTHLDVADHWNGGVGSAVCGDGSEPTMSTEAAYALRSIICTAARQRLFNVILTPNYNQAHHNHFHLDISATAQSFTLR